MKPFVFVTGEWDTDEYDNDTFEPNDDVERTAVGLDQDGDLVSYDANGKLTIELLEDAKFVRWAE